MNQLTDSHLDDQRTDKDFRDEQYAQDLRDAAVLDKQLKILADVREIQQLLTEYPDTVARLIQPLMGENYEDYVPEFREGINRLAHKVADDDTMHLDAFRYEKEEQ